MRLHERMSFDDLFMLSEFSESINDQLMPTEQMLLVQKAVEQVIDDFMADYEASKESVNA